MSTHNTAQIWNTESGQQMAILKGHDGLVLTAAFSPDGRRLITGGTDKTARIWDVETGQVMTVLTGHTDRVAEVAFSTDGQRVITLSGDQTAGVWDVETGKMVGQLRHTDRVLSASFNRDGSRVITASDTTARVWTLPSTDDLIEQAKLLTPRCLTITQRQIAVIDLAPSFWCIEMKKWPYHTPEWELWLHHTRNNANPPFPGTPEWQPWLAARK
jgi:WD40 repeat protein